MTGHYKLADKVPDTWTDSTGHLTKGLRWRLEAAGCGPEVSLETSLRVASSSRLLESPPRVVSARRLDSGQARCEASVQVAPP